MSQNVKAVTLKHPSKSIKRVWENKRNNQITTLLHLHWLQLTHQSLSAELQFFQTKRFLQSGHAVRLMDLLVYQNDTGSKSADQSEKFSPQQPLKAEIISVFRNVAFLFINISRHGTDNNLRFLIVILYIQYNAQTVLKSECGWVYPPLHDRMQPLWQ